MSNLCFFALQKSSGLAWIANPTREISKRSRQTADIELKHNGIAICSIPTSSSEKTNSLDVSKIPCRHIY